MSGIRVTYSGLIAFIISITSIFTGFVFSVVLTRLLTPEEFGTWNLITGLLVYGLIIEPIISYWSTREIARRTEYGKTSLFFGGIFSIVASVIYLIISYVVGSQSQADTDVLFFGVILIPLMFMNRILNAINLGWKPEIASYGVLLLEIIKIPMIILLVYLFDFGVKGAILAMAIAQMGGIILQTLYARKKIKNEIRKEIFKKWIKFSWIPFYPSFVGVLVRMDIIIFTMMTQSVVGLAFYSIAVLIGSIPTYAAPITSTSYSKLLEGGKTNFLQDNLTILFYFSIPLAAISIIFAKPGAILLNPIYVAVSPIIIFITIRFFFRNLGITFLQYLTGAENVDVNLKSTVKDYLNSKIFSVPNIRAIYYGTYLALLAIFLFLLKQNNSNEIELVLYWAILGLVSDVPFAIHLYLIVRKNFKLRLDVKRIMKFLIVCAIIFGAISVSMDRLIDYDDNFLGLVSNVLLLMGLGVAGYLAITYFIDLKTKILLKSIIYEIKNRMI